MPDISSIGHESVGPLDRTAPPHARGDASSPPRIERPPQRPGDRVELSDHARLLDQLRRMPEVRSERVEEVRKAIADGTYETEARLEEAIDRLLQDLLVN
jgi:flagellar biosynthesis anti-sigma factor FlgM